MSRMKNFSGTLLLLAMTTMAGLAVAFPFWLNAPARSNPFDGKCDSGRCDTPTRTPVPTLAGTATFTTVPTSAATATPGIGPVLLETFPGAGANDDFNQPIIISSTGTI